MNELRIRNQSREQYVRDYSSVWRDGIEVYDPSIWLARDPDAEEKMLRDADIAYAINYRRHLIAGQRWTCSPQDGDETEQGKLAAEVASDLIGNIRHFATARIALARAFFSGSRFARIHGKPKTLTIGDGRPRVWWVPTMLEDQDKRFYRPVVENDGEVVRAHWERWDVAHMRWEPESSEDAVCTIRHVYQDHQGTLGHGTALREALGWWWYNKTHLLQESVMSAEKHGGGILRAKIDGLRDGGTDAENSARITAWVNKLEDMRSRHVIAHDSRDDVDVIAPAGTGWQLLKELRDEARISIATLVLGANMNTSATEGGSYALAEVHENATEALVQFDRHTLEETLSDDLIGCLWFKNHANLVDMGIAGVRPRFDLTQEKRQDPAQRAAVAAQLSGMGIALSMDDVLDQTGFRKPREDEERIEPRAVQPSLPGFGGDFLS